jgi:molybdate-binding protein
LAALAQGRCDLAGFHVADALPRAAAAAAALGRWLDPRKHMLIHFVTREQGLIVRPESNIRGVHDLARPGVRFIHRQSTAEVVPGRDGRSVAATVSEGRADAAFGLRPDAMRYKLEFVPLAVERYFLAATRAAVRDHAALRIFLDGIRSADFAQLVARLPGYEGSKAGVHEELRAALNWVGGGRRPANRKRAGV